MKILTIKNLKIMKTKITLFALFLIALGISVRVNAQDLIVTNNTSCAIVVTFSSVDQVTCTISSAGPTTVNPSTTVTLPGPLPNGVVYKAQGKVGSSACSVIDCSTNYTGCNPPSPCGGSSNTGTIPTTSCGTPAPYMTITAAPSGSNGTLVIN
jgi:hypothetical protein